MQPIVHALHTTPPGVALVVLLALVAGCYWAAQSRSAASLWTLLALVTLWLLTDQPLEGDVLLALTPTHGFTSGDLLGLSLGALALLVRRATR